MSEEKLDRVEHQLSQLLQGMTIVQQGVGEIKQDISAMKQNDNALREDIHDLQNRINSIEGAIMLIVRDGASPIRNCTDELKFEISEMQRRNGLLNRRGRRVERRESTDNFEY